MSGMRRSHKTSSHGGGGLVSSASDYLKFAQLLLNKGALGNVRLLSPKTVELMTMNQLPARGMPLAATLKTLDTFVHGYGFCLGLRVLVDVPASGSLGTLGSFGWAGARNTFVWIDPKEDLVALLMIQYAPWRAYPIDKEFETLMYQAFVR
jgi:CubicO group peptidase (beta-lactamase class C family)